jgi:hypothetical protein
MKYWSIHSIVCGLKRICRKDIFRSAYSFIELQIAMVILAIGLLSFAGLYRVYSLQTNYLEPNSMSVSTYYVVSQSDRWMRQLGAPAQIVRTAGQLPWTPPVPQADRVKTVTLSADPNENFTLNQAILSVTVEE